MKAALPDWQNEQNELFATVCSKNISCFPFL